MHVEMRRNLSPNLYRIGLRLLFTCTGTRSYIINTMNEREWVWVFWMMGFDHWPKRTNKMETMCIYQMCDRLYSDVIHLSYDTFMLKVLCQQQRRQLMWNSVAKKNQWHNRRHYFFLQSTTQPDYRPSCQCKRYQSFPFLLSRDNRMR